MLKTFPNSFMPQQQPEFYNSGRQQQQFVAYHEPTINQRYYPHPSHAPASFCPPQPNPMQEHAEYESCVYNGR